MTSSASDALVAGRFEMGARVGQGGMGTVFRGVDTQTGAVVAIKLMNPESVLHDPGSLERFGREGEALRRLNHPNIVKVLATVQDGERHCPVMEWVGGGSLDELLKSREAPLGIDRVLEIALDLSDALTRSHRLEIIHRDIKPANVMLSDDGTPRLTDFGVAHVVGEKSVTLPNTIVGTLDYLSPEALRGEPVDVRTDVWGFGVLLFEMLTRKRPFSEGNFAQTLYAIANKPVPDIEALRSDCPTALVDLIYRMLEKQRDERIPSVRQVGAELENVLLGRTGSLHRDSPNATKSIHSHGKGGGERGEGLARAATRPARAWHSTEREPLAAAPLPAEITPFIGRKQELAKLARLLADPAARMVTILAPGGIGKSRFALEATRRIVEGIGDFAQTLRVTTRFTDGIFFVPLAPLGSPELVVATIAEAIGLELQRSREPTEQLLGYVRDKNMLLVLDNFEHVLEGAGVVGDILRAAPRSVALATSRERLGLSGETIFELGGMEVPGLDAAADPRRSSAVELFVVCARRAKADFELSVDATEAVLRVCRLVEGMPLGIVLAASWVGVMTPAEIANEIGRSFDFLTTEMRDVPERQQSLRAAFDHSWKLLDEQQRTTFSRLCVFRGGFGRVAAEVVAEASIRTLGALTHKSLLRRDPNSGRYEIHETLRQYAEERLREAPESYERTLDLHAAYYATFLAERAGRLNEREPVAGLDEIETEIDNVRAAWKHMLVRKQLSLVASAMPGLKNYYLYRATFVEAETVFAAAVQSLDAPRDARSDEQARLLGVALSLQAMQCQSLGRARQAIALGTKALVLLDETAHPKERAKALVDMGTSRAQIGNRRQAVVDLEQALALFRAADEPIGAGWALIYLGNVHAWDGDYAQAEGPLRESIAIHEREAQRSVLLVHALVGLGTVLARQGDFQEGCRLLSRALRMNEELNDPWGTLGGQISLAYACRGLGHYAEAETWARSCLSRSRELGASYHEAWCWIVLGDILRDQGRLEEAAECLGGASRREERTDDPRCSAALRLHQGELALLQGDFALAEARFSRDIAWFEDLGIVWGIALGLDGLGCVTLHAGDLATARFRFGRALAAAMVAKARPFAHHVAASVALLFAKSGETVRAVELLARVRSDSATERRTHTQRVDPLLAELEKELPPDVLFRALERGKTLVLEKLRDELIRSGTELG